MLDRWRRDFKQYWTDLNRRKDQPEATHDFQGRKKQARKAGEGPAFSH
jgi:hypothetical protein